MKFHVNIVNLSPRGMDGFGIYFGDDTIDTITKCNRPLTYLTPQVANPLGNVITDTLNWVPITGTFVANGTEKFALIGNFLADNAVTTAPINTPYFPQVWTDVLIDDVSCIDLDLPAFAGRDTACVTGNTVYIGRSRDVGIDEACTWFQLPDMNTVIATGAGFMVSPNGITSYVVRQEICGNVKWDTVTVTENPVGFQALKINDQGLKMYPIPAGDQLIMEGLYENDWLFIEISDMSGRHVLSQHVQQEGLIAKLELSLMNGAYLVKIKFGKNEQAVKKLLIAK